MGLRMALRRHGVARVLVACAAGWAAIASNGAEVSGQHANPLFNQTNQPAVISQQMHLALPSAERGLALLTSGGDSGQLKLAMESINDTYRYLRAAQESKQNLNNWAKVRDPLVEIETKRIWQIRLHMLACLNEGQHIINQNEAMISRCAEHLTAGIRELRFLLTVMP